MVFNTRKEQATQPLLNFWSLIRQTFLKQFLISSSFLDAHFHIFTVLCVALGKSFLLLKSELKPSHKKKVKKSLHRTLQCLTLGESRELSYEERLREMRMFSLKKAAGWPHWSFSILKESLNKKDGKQIFARADNDRTRGNGFKLKEGRQIRGNSSLTGQWVALEVLGARLGEALGDLV